MQLGFRHSERTFVFHYLDQCDQIGRFIGLWATFKAFDNN